jgi:Na+-translocating ferredoxin:NAD+ oxidoreductase subunit E
VSYLQLPRPAARIPAPWLALLTTPLVIGTDSLAHAALIVIVAAIAIAVLQLVDRATRHSDEELRNCVVLIAGTGLATCADLVLLAYAFPLYRSLPLLAPAVLAITFVHMTHPSAPGERSPTRYAELSLALLTLGVAREIVGHGSLLHDLAAPVSVKFLPPEMGFFLAALAPGAFIALGILVAIIQWLHSRFQKQ